MSELQRRRALVSVGELAYVDEGDPENAVVLLLHGGATNADVWTEVARMLSPWARAIAPDLVGAGDSVPSANADLRMRGQAAYVRELLGRLGLERFAVVGQGIGGGIAQLLALEGGADAMVLIDSPAFGMHWSPPGEGEGPRPFGIEEGALDDTADELAGLPIPALVVYGEEDPFLPTTALAERFAEILQMGSVALLPGRGHFLLQTAPGTVVPLVFQWLRSQYLKLVHTHEDAPVVVELGRRPPGQGR